MKGGGGRDNFPGEEFAGSGAAKQDEIIHRVYNLTHRFESLLLHGTMRHFRVGGTSGVTRLSIARSISSDEK